MSSLIELHGNLKHARLIAGFTQISLASHIGITSHHYSEIERGKARPSAITAKKIADAVSADWHSLFSIVTPHKSRISV